MNIIDSQNAQRFNLNEQTLETIRQFGEHFPGGFLSIGKKETKNCYMSTRHC